MPNLIIGLGGTGTEVVRRIRERWDSAGVPANVGLAVIDARHREPQGGRIEDVSFTPNQPIAFPDQFAHFRSEVGGWWPSAVAPSPRIDYSDGCGAIRAYGRFYAMRFASNVEATIRDAIRHVIAKNPRRVSEQATSFQVFLVASLGNGTGGGTFLDVSAMVKYLLSFYTQNVRVYGVFVPGSVTRRYHTGNILHDRIGASSYAALLELQYEFNRCNPGSDLRPRQPYVFRGLIGDDYQAYQPYEDADQPALDDVLLLDGRDRNGLESDYPTLLNVAAEGIGMLVEGADADARLVDAFAQKDPDKRFGSYGAVRLVVPADRLLTYTVNHMAIEAVGAGTSDDPATWPQLLADESPDHKQVLLADEATLPGSVDFFLEHVLAVKESDADGGGSSHNQLFDRFKAEDDGLRRQFDRLLSGVENLDEPKKIVGKATAITNFVLRNTRDLVKAREDALLGGGSSLWGRAPADPAEPIDAGVKWLLDQRVERFVAAGAFGLLSAWLGELKRQVDANRESVQAHERREWLSQPDHGKIDLKRELRDLHADADSFFAIFRKGQLKEDVASVHQEATKKFRFLLWESQIFAVEQFYQRLYAYVEMLERAATTARSRLRDPRLEVLTHRRDEAERELDDRLGHETTSQGLKAEFFIGGDATMRGELVAALQAGPDTNGNAILGGLSDANRGLFLGALGTDVARFDADGAEEVPAGDTTAVMDAYRRELVAEVTGRIQGLVSARTRIDALLALEAERTLEEYFRIHHVEREAIDQGPRQEIARRIRENAGQALSFIQALDWAEDKAAAMDKAIDYYIAGKLYNALAFATPQWSLDDRDPQRLFKLFRYSFVTFPADARRIDQAAEQISTLGLGGQQMRRVHATADRLMDPRRIDIVVAELGADLEMLDTGAEAAIYRKVMKSPGAFSPHLTTHAEGMGRRMLQSSDAGGGPGAVLLGLAEHLGFVSSDRAGNYAIARALDGDPAAGLRAYAEGVKIGRGLDAVIAGFDAPTGDTARLIATLKPALWAGLREQAIGGPGAPGVGWDGLAKAMAAHASELIQKAGAALDETHGAALRLQGEGLEALAAELVRLGGAEPPTVLR